LAFDSEEDFYFLQIYKRRKDNPELYRDMYVMNNYYIYSLEQYDRIQEDIIKECTVQNARAYIRLNRRNAKKVAFKVLTKLSVMLDAGQYKDVKAIFPAACGEVNSEPVKKWVVDVDTKDTETLHELIFFIKELQEISEKYKVEGIIPTKNGNHIISNPFNTKTFKDKYPHIDIQKDNPTILYIP